jgi:hypothetical protein
MIDSVYEYAGVTLAELTRAAFSSLGLFLLAALAGTAWIVHEISSERAGVRQLGVHLGALVILWGLLSPTRSAETPAPRLLVWLGRAADVAQSRMIHAINARFLDAPFAWERLAALSARARIYDPALRQDVEAFLDACAKPALARAAPAGDNLLADGVLPYDQRCQRARAELRARVARHVERDPAHQAALSTASAHDPAGATAFRARYEEEVCRRAADDPGSPTNEAALVASAVGSYSYLDRAQSTGEFPWWVKLWPYQLPGLSDVWEGAANAAISGVAQLQQSWDNRFTAKQKYYLASTLGPHVYGLTLMVLLGFFPVAGLYALLPGKWTALANWGKAFVSVKLWPVAWAALTSFNAKRSALEAFDPGPRGSGDVFLAVSSMYLLTPALCFLIVHLGARAAAAPFQPALPPPSGPGLGPAGAAVSIALKAK